MSKSDRFTGQAYEVGQVKWRAVGTNRAVSSRGHIVLFPLGENSRNEFLRRSREEIAAKKLRLTLTDRERISLDTELL